MKTQISPSALAAPRLRPPPTPWLAPSTIQLASRTALQRDDALQSLEPLSTRTSGWWGYSCGPHASKAIKTTAGRALLLLTKLISTSLIGRTGAAGQRPG